MHDQIRKLYDISIEGSTSISYFVADIYMNLPLWLFDFQAGDLFIVQMGGGGCGKAVVSIK